MTTNNPPIAAWAPSSALAKLASRHNNAPCVLTDGPAEFNDVALIRLADYQRLQAECEKLRKDAERYQWLRADALSAYEDDLDEPQLVYARECVGDYQDCIDAAIDSAMQETNNDNQ